MMNAKPPRSILVGVDYTPESAHAAGIALELARAFGAKVHLLHAWEAPYAPSDGSLAAPVVPHANHPNLLAMLKSAAEEVMASFVSPLNTEGLEVTSSVESGDPRTILPNYAQAHTCDWVVLGKRRMSRVAEWFLGNVAAHVVRHCQVPVLVIPSDSESGHSSA